VKKVFGIFKIKFFFNFVLSCYILTYRFFFIYTLLYNLLACYDFCFVYFWKVAIYLCFKIIIYLLKLFFYVIWMVWCTLQILLIYNFSISESLICLWYFMLFYLYSISWNQSYLVGFVHIYISSHIYKKLIQQRDTV